MLKSPFPSCHSFWYKARDNAITYFLLFQILERKVCLGPVSASWMRKGGKNYRKPHWTHNNILKYNMWIWKEKCLEGKIFYRRGHFKLLSKSKSGIKSGHYKHKLCCIFITTYAFCTIYLNTTISITQKWVLFQLSHWHTQISSVSVYASAAIYNFMPFEINCTLNLKAILGSLVCSTDPIFDI